MCCISKFRLSIIIALLIFFSYPAVSSAQFAQCSNHPGANPYTVLVLKSKGQVIVSKDGKPAYIFPIATLGWNPVGPKTREGDGKTPEGEYCIVFKNDNSICRLRLSHHKKERRLSLLISYPNIEDLEKGLAKQTEDIKRGFKHPMITANDEAGIIDATRNHSIPPQDTPLGSYVTFHGYQCMRHPEFTFGCAALYDDDMEKLFDLIPQGTPVTIKP